MRRMLASTMLGLLALFVPAAGRAEPPLRSFYLPDPVSARTLSMVTPGAAAPAGSLVVLTVPVAIKESGPAATVAAFGEVYAFSPAFFAVTAGEPVRIAFWNLQPDDEHDVMIMDPGWRVLAHLDLPPLQKVTYDYTFRVPGLYPFVCTMHGPAMSGQILVLPRGWTAAAR